MHANAFYHKFVHTHTHTLIPTSSACPHLISPHQHNQRCAGWSSSSLFCQTLVHLLPRQPRSHLLQVSSLKRNNKQNISGVLHSEMSFWPLELQMFVERFVAVLGPLSITFNSFVLFWPVVRSQQEKKSNKKCFSWVFLCVFTLGLDLSLGSLCRNLCHLTVWPAWHQCLHANTVNPSWTG